MRRISDRFGDWKRPSLFHKLGVDNLCGCGIVITSKANKRPKQTKTKMEITTGTKLTARSVCDSECVFEATVIERKGAFAAVRFQGKEKRVKVRQDEWGEFVFADGQYSMCPVFRPVAAAVISQAAA